MVLTVWILKHEGVGDGGESDLRGFLFDRILVLEGGSSVSTFLRVRLLRLSVTSSIY